MAKVEDSAREWSYVSANAVEEDDLNKDSLT